MDSISKETITAVIPGTIGKNPFWSSVQGESLFISFLESISTIKRIRRMVVFSTDSYLSSLATKNGIQIISPPCPLPDTTLYTLQQFITMARIFNSCFAEKKEILLFIDYRNLNISPGKLDKALGNYALESKDNILIGMSKVKDHPCQWVSYYTFLECKIFTINDLYTSNEDCNITIDSDIESCSFALNFKIGKDTVSTDSILIETSGELIEPLVIQVAPFAGNNVNFESTRFVYIDHNTGNRFRIQFSSQMHGIIVTLFSKSLSGAYNVREKYTSKNAPWAITSDDHKIIDKKSGKTINGRQQFHNVYMNDGSVFGIHANSVLSDCGSLGRTFLHWDSHIVENWIDFFYSQINFCH